MVGNTIGGALMDHIYSILWRRKVAAPLRRRMGPFCFFKLPATVSFCSRVRVLVKFSKHAYGKWNRGKNNIHNVPHLYVYKHQYMSTSFTLLLSATQRSGFDQIIKSSLEKSRRTVALLNSLEFSPASLRYLLP
ncbi:hypothetical protein YC2023_030186 [Brassica napus]